MKRWKVFTGIVLIGITAGIIYGWTEYHRAVADTMHLDAKAKKKATQLIKEFKADENLANGQYNGKPVSVTGSILKIERIANIVIVSLGDNQSVTAVNCELQPDHIDQADKLQVGEQVTIKGICTGMLMDVVMIRCVVE